MKRILSILFLSFCCTLAFGQSKKKATIDIATNISCDHCLRCGSCAPRIQRAIRVNKGIKMVNVDPNKNVITVKYKTKKTSAEKIKEAINNAGFDADELKAPTHAYDQLDACCKRTD